MKEFNTLQPLGRLGTPDDIANAIEYLISNKASWISGTIIEVDAVLWPVEIK